MISERCFTAPEANNCQHGKPTNKAAKRAKTQGTKRNAQTARALLIQAIGKAPYTSLANRQRAIRDHSRMLGRSGDLPSIRIAKRLKNVEMIRRKGKTFAKDSELYRSDTTRTIGVIVQRTIVLVVDDTIAGIRSLGTNMKCR